MVGDAFAEPEVDPVRMVDEKSQGFLARLLERDQIELGIELVKLCLNVLLKILLGCHAAEKKVGQAHFSYAIRIEKA